MENKDNLTRREFLKFISRTGGTLLVGFSGLGSLVGLNFSPFQKTTDTPTPKATSTWKPTKTLTPTLTRRPGATATPTATITQSRGATATEKASPSPTMTRRPLATPTDTLTPIPTSTHFTKTPTPTSTLSPTPDLRGLVIPSEDNFELVIGHLALAINAISVIQEGKNEFDKTDLIEDFLNFNREKYETYKKGKRPYRYLRFQEIRKSTDPKAEVHVRAVIVVPNSFGGTNEVEYLDMILNYLRKVLKVATYRIDDTQRSVIARDIGESNRLTCIKFLRFVWALFGENPQTGMGLFPEVYQARIVNAGELGRQIPGGKSIFDPSNTGIVKPTYIKDALALSEQPENDPDFFDGQIMVFFRPAAYETESGHVGVGKLNAQRDEKGNLVRFLMTFIEVDGNTGQAYYGYRLDLDDFRAHLFMSSQSPEGLSARTIGWMFNRH